MMSVFSRRLALALVVGAVGLSTGCDLGALAYFLMPEAREPAKMRSLASVNAKKPTRVVIFTWAGLEMRSDFVNADRQLSEMLAAKLSELAKDNEEGLVIVPPRKVTEYKNSHPRWRELDLAEIGRQFSADYVIYLEFHSLSMYEPGMANQLLRGRAQMTISLVDVHRPDDSPSGVPFSTVYPSDARGPVQAGFDVQPMEFRQAFLAHIAKNLSYYFSRYSKRETYFTD
jgi:hypothetical protein